MRNKTLIIMVAVLAILSGLTALVVYMANKKDAEVAMGALLFEKLDVNRASVIKVTTSAGTFTVSKKAGAWQVDKGFDYPADFDKVSRFLRGLTELKVGRAFDANPERLARLTLATPGDSAFKKENQGALFVVLDEAGKEIARIVAGKERSGKDQFQGMPQGQYLLTGEGKRIYLVDRYFEMEEQKTADWIDKSLTNVDAADIKSVVCKSAAEGISPTVLYEIARAEKGKEITAVVFPAGKKAKRSDMDRMSQFLSALTCDDVSKSDGNVKAERIIDFITFSGVTYRIGVCGATTEEGCPVRVEVLYGGSDKKIAEDAKKDNARLAPWVFRVGKWRCDYLARDAEALVEKPPVQPSQPLPGMSAGGMPPGFDPQMFGAP